MLRADQNGWPVSKHLEESAIDRVHDEVRRRIEPIQNAAYCVRFMLFLCHDIFPFRFSFGIILYLYSLIAAKGTHILSHILVVIQDISRTSCQYARRFWFWFGLRR